MNMEMRNSSRLTAWPLCEMLGSCSIAWPGLIEWRLLAYWLGTTLDVTVQIVYQPTQYHFEKTFSYLVESLPKIQ